MKKVAILQSNYIPWRGYFDIIRHVDLFIFHDDLQYTKNDWRNRNLIKTSNGVEWLTIPCGTNEHRLINEVTLNDHAWQKKHWAKIYQNYRKAPYFKLYSDFFECIYLEHSWTYLSELNQFLIKHISQTIFNFKTEFDNSENYSLENKKADRVIELLGKCHATDYVSGPAAKKYLLAGDFLEKNIKLTWFDYSNYPEYQQQFGLFQGAVSIVDLLFNCGDRSVEYMKSI